MIKSGGYSPGDGRVRMHLGELPAAGKIEDQGVWVQSQSVRTQGRKKQGVLAITYVRGRGEDG